MKQIRITLTEQQWIDIQNLIGEIPTKWGIPLVNTLVPNAQESNLEDPKPIGGGGSGPQPPKPNNE